MSLNEGVQKHFVLFLKNFGNCVKITHLIKGRKEGKTKLGKGELGQNNNNNKPSSGPKANQRTCNEVI